MTSSSSSKITNCQGNSAVIWKIALTPKNYFRENEQNVNLGQPFFIGHKTR